MDFLTGIFQGFWRLNRNTYLKEQFWTAASKEAKEVTAWKGMFWTHVKNFDTWIKHIIIIFLANILCYLKLKGWNDILYSDVMEYPLKLAFFLQIFGWSQFFTEFGEDIKFPKTNQTLSIWQNLIGPATSHF